MCRTDKDKLASKAIKQSKTLEASVRPEWICTLGTASSDFLKCLNTRVLSLGPSKNNINDPLFRIFNQEVQC
ncbi:hypothetical protein BY996DRAFT_7541059 [Phakopsora pachyrhizi]|nr:hypothetical protein BY996DRAFT_7541059 [Phakopsora pachyrhizi]